MDASKKILIVGGGVAGLVLAQVLRANGIPFEIFERDAAYASRGQGWSVTLAECIPELDELLPKDLGNIDQVSTSYGLDSPDSVAVWGMKEERVIARTGGVARGEKGFMLRGSRPKLREWLWPNIDVQTNKRFSHYTEDRDSVTVHFEDGTTATGALLVGADGSKSRIRAQMLGEDGHKSELSKFQSIIGDVKLPRTKYQELCETSTSTIVTMMKGLIFVYAVTEAKKDGSADGFWSVVWPTDDPAADAAWLQAASKKSKYQKVQQLSRDLPPFLREIIDLSGPDDISDPPVVFSEFIPPNALPRGRATLMGDAAHSMLPFRGAGANTAIRDACELGRLIVKNQSSGESVDWMLKQYESVALPRGREYVLSSRQSGENPEIQAANVIKGRHSTMDHIASQNSAGEIQGTA